MSKWLRRMVVLMVVPAAIVALAPVAGASETTATETQREWVCAGEFVPLPGLQSSHVYLSVCVDPFYGQVSNAGSVQILGRWLASWDAYHYYLEESWPRVRSTGYCIRSWPYEVPNPFQPWVLCNNVETDA